KPTTAIVKEINQAPVLAAIGNKTVDEGTLLTFTATATDPDLPANTLSFSLDPGAPAGASINSATGTFSWTPTFFQAGTYSVTVRVTDSGTPAASNVETISIVVNAVAMLDIDAAGVVRYSASAGVENNLTLSLS